MTTDIVSKSNSNSNSVELAIIVCNNIFNTLDNRKNRNNLTNRNIEIISSPWSGSEIYHTVGFALVYANWIKYGAIVTKSIKFINLVINNLLHGATIKRNVNSMVKQMQQSTSNTINDITCVVSTVPIYFVLLIFLLLYFPMTLVVPVMLVVFFSSCSCRSIE